MNRERLIPVAGILAVIAVILAFVIGGETPDGDDSLSKIVRFYRDNDSEQMIAASFLGWGSALLMVFAGGFWRLLRNAETERYGSSTLFVIGATMWAVGASIFAGLTFALGDFADDLTPSAMQTLNALNSDMFFTLALGTFGFSMGAGVAVLKTAVLPKWLGWFAIVIGALAITPIGFFAILVMGLWVVIASVVLLMRSSTPAPAAP
jgi:hypothetical protein